MENLRLMNQIVSEMKEVPVLASEEIKPNDTQALIKVEFPNAGGVLTFMENHDLPYKGFPYFEFVDKIDIMKKIIRSTLSGLYHALKRRRRLQLLTLFLSPWFFKDFLRAEIYTMYRLIARFKVKPIRYCDMGRELHRAFGDGEAGEFRPMLRDLVCMVLEFDNAYRYRFQDVITELDQEELARRPIRELRRLLKVMSTREKTQEIKDTWRLIDYVVRFYLPFDRELKDVIVQTFLKLDLKLVKLSAEDEHYCGPRKDYQFGFMEKESVVVAYTATPTMPSSAPLEATG